MNSFLDAIYLKLDDPSATITVDHFGNFTAYFTALPPPLPPQYWASLFTVAITALVGSWLTPSIIGWRKERKQKGKLDSYNKKIKGLPNDDNDNLSSYLKRLKDDVTSSYTMGRINKEQNDKLTNDISLRYKKILETEINNGDINHVPLENIKKNIADAYSEGKITELHYKLLDEWISNATAKEQSRNDS